MLLPGLDGATKLRQAFLDQLATRFQVTALDYPTEVANDYASLLTWVVERLPTDPFVLVGESFGGPLACAVAARRPMGLRGLVLVASFLRRPLGLGDAIAARLPLFAAAWVPTAAWRWALFDAQTESSMIADTQAAVRALPPKLLAERRRTALSVDARPWLKTVDVPVLALQATGDRLLTAASQSELTATLPTLQRRLIEGPHALLQCRPEACAEAIGSWWPVHGG